MVVVVKGGGGVRCGGSGETKADYIEEEEFGVKTPFFLSVALMLLIQEECVGSHSIMD